MKKQSTFASLFIVCLAPAIVLAQTPRIDSLRKELQLDSLNYVLLSRLAALLADKNDVEAMTYAKKAKSISLTQSDTAFIVRSSRLIGQLYNRQSNVRMAIEELAPLLAVAERHNLRDETKKILNSLAISFNSLGEYDRALDYHLKSMSAKSKDNDKEGVAVSLNNIGLLYYKMENYSRALYYWTQCLKLKLEVNDVYDLDALYLNLGLCYAGLRDFELAKQNVGKVLSTCAPNCTKRILIHTEFVKGELHLYQNELTDAVIHLERSLALAREEHNLEFEFESLLDLTKVAFAKNDLISVGTYLRRISKLVGKEQFVAAFQSFNKLSRDYFIKMGNRNLASHYEREYFDLEAKINGSEMHRRIMEIQMNFIEKENSAELEGQRRLLEAQGRVIRNQTVINWLLFGVATLTVCLLFVLFKMNVRKAATNKRLDGLVRERTRELEKSRNELVQSLNEQKIVLSMISSKLVSSLATVSGLSNLARLENLPKEHEYSAGVERVLSQLIESIRGLEIESGQSCFVREINAGHSSMK